MKKRQPEPLGATWAGNWQECPALQMAFDRGSMVYDEASFCSELGIALQDLETWLARNCREQSIDAVANGEDHVGVNNLSLVRPHGHFFEVRLFSPVQPTSDPIRKLRRAAVRPQTM